MRAIVVALALLGTVGCGPDCLRGHDELTLIPAHEEEDVSYIHIGDVMMPLYHTRHVPDHYRRVFVCDAYQLEAQ